MRNFSRAAILVVVLFCGGCVPKVAKENIQTNTAAQKEFVKRMDAGQTTREQEQVVIRAQLRNWEAMDWLLNGNPLTISAPAPVPAKDPAK